MTREDGTIATNVSEIHSLTRKAWTPIFNIDWETDAPPPDVTTFLAAMDKYVVKVPMRLPDITGSDLMRHLQAVRTGRATGMTGWAVRELQLLPLIFLDRLAELFTLIEDGADWPQQLEFVRGLWLDKGEQGLPTQQRPIRIYDVLYSIYSGLRYNQTAEWRAQVLPHEMKGAKDGCTTHDAVAPTVLRVEQCNLNGSHLAGASLDRVKCFDR